ncbi:MAG: hypothetical protein RHS_0676 [Robinsoniella sp. RHS]|nr:MAG: hypothetical protein RHS_0676 [Robinsoniella sp. RHS]
MNVLKIAMGIKMTKMRSTINFAEKVFLNRFPILQSSFPEFEPNYIRKRSTCKQEI